MTTMTTVGESEEGDTGRRELYPSWLNVSAMRARELSFASNLSSPDLRVDSVNYSRLVPDSAALFRMPAFDGKLTHIRNEHGVVNDLLVEATSKPPMRGK